MYKISNGNISLMKQQIVIAQLRTHNCT